MLRKQINGFRVLFIAKKSLLSSSSWVQVSPASGSEEISRRWLIWVRVIRNQFWSTSGALFWSSDSATIMEKQGQLAQRLKKRKQQPICLLWYKSSQLNIALDLRWWMSWVIKLFMTHSFIFSAGKDKNIWIVKSRLFNFFACSAAFIFRNRENYLKSYQTYKFSFSYQSHHNQLFCMTKYWKKFSFHLFNFSFRHARLENLAFFYVKLWSWHSTLNFMEFHETDPKRDTRHQVNWQSLNFLLLIIVIEMKALSSGFDLRFLYFFTLKMFICRSWMDATYLQQLCKSPSTIN